MTGNAAKNHDRDFLAGVRALDTRLPAWMTPRAVLLLLLAISFVVDLGFGFIFKFRVIHWQLDADEAEYYNMAGQIMAGMLQFTARRTLAFPLLLAGIRSISDNFVFLQATVAVLYSFSAPLLFLVVRKVTRSTAAGALAGLVLAIWPPVIYYGVSLYSEPLALPVSLLALWALPCGSRTGNPRLRTDWRQALVAGFVLALATQVRPMYLIMTPFLASIIFIEEADWRIAARRLMLAAAAFTITTLPWSAFMTARFHHPILVTSNGGETLAGAMTPKLLEASASGYGTTNGRTYWTGPGKWLTVQDNGYLSPAELKLPYDVQDALLKARATAWIKAHPGSALYIEMCKLAYMWGIYPLVGNGASQVIFGNIPTVALLALALFGFATLPKARTALVRFWMLPLFVSAVAAISWGSWQLPSAGRRRAGRLRGHMRARALRSPAASRLSLNASSC